MIAIPDIAPVFGLAGQLAPEKSQQGSTDYVDRVDSRAAWMRVMDATGRSKKHIGESDLLCGMSGRGVSCVPHDHALFR